MHWNAGIINAGWRLYFQELFRLQRELVRLRDWVAHNKIKVVAALEFRPDCLH